MKVLKVFENGGFEVSETCPASNNVYFGPAEYFPHSEKELQAQIDFYTRQNGPGSIIDLRKPA